MAVKWLDEPETHDYDAAADYLSLLGESAPVAATVAALATECRLMACQVAGSGVQECAAGWGGGWLVSATQSGSSLPMRMRSPLEVA